MIAVAINAIGKPAAGKTDTMLTPEGFITLRLTLPIVVEATTNLTGAPWLALQTCTLTNGSVTFTDPNWTNYPARFYRIRSP
jgi:hypothetical protein